MNNFKKPRILLKKQTLIRGKMRVDYEPEGQRYTARLSLSDSNETLADVTWTKDTISESLPEEHEIDIAQRQAWLHAIAQIAKGLGYDVKFVRRIEG